MTLIAFHLKKFIFSKIVALAVTELNISAEVTLVHYSYFKIMVYNKIKDLTFTGLILLNTQLGLDVKFLPLIKTFPIIY